jgi:hypothetical protein
MKLDVILTNDTKNDGMTNRCAGRDKTARHAGDHGVPKSLRASGTIRSNGRAPGPQLSGVVKLMTIERVGSLRKA